MDPNVEDIFPLTPTQRGMLFHTVYAPESGVYVNQLSNTFTGPLDVAAFRAAWQAVVDATPVLRTAFVWRRAEEPRQIVLRRAEIDVEELDWSARSADDQRRALAQLLAADARQGFDLAKPPLMRLKLVKLAPDTRRFIWTKHHILLDGWSNQLVMKHVFHAYVAASVGEAPRLPSAMPFAEYVRWLQRRDREETSAFWRERLRGFREPTVLGIDRAEASSRGPDGDYTQIEADMPPRLGAELQAFAAQAHVTPSVVLQAAWSVVLAAYGGRPDVVFGTTVSGRSAPLTGIDDAIGLFINTVPMRIRVDADRPAREWVQDVHKAALEVRQHEWSVLSDVRAASEVPSGRPLFESIVVYENYPASDELLRPGGSGASLGITSSEVEYAERINYPLTLVISPRISRIELAYDRRRFDEADVARMLRHVLAAVEALVRPGARVRAALAPPTTEEERAAWSGPSLAPSPGGVHETVAAHARTRPDAIAVTDGRNQITYAELHRRASRLARWMQRRGVRPGDRVGVLLERSIEQVTALLAILEAGAAFLPLDPTYPPERVAHICGDARVALLLSRGALASERVTRAVDVVDVGALGGELDAEDDAPPSGVGSGPSSVAYLVCTSGSTGTPKEVVLTHAGLSNTARALVDGFGIDRDSRVLQFASVGFDGCVGDVFSALVAGAVVSLVEVEAQGSARGFVEQLRREQITNITLPPSFLRVVPPADLPALRTIACVGEACPSDVVDRWQPGRTFINGYGPSEITISATLMPARSGDGPPPIGFPVANTTCVVVTPEGEPAPVGVAGELLLGGVGVAIGYAERPALTAERFVPDAISGTAGARLYATGDVVRRRPDGSLEFVGRVDEQVKLRGFRIELREIEEVVARQPGVAEVAVVVVDLGDGDRRLEAHVVAGSPGTVDAARLRAAVAEVLPEYMVPSVSLHDQPLPRNVNGKIDRKLLAEARPAPAPTAAVADGPRTDAEAKLTAIWQRVLRLGAVGLDDDFFEAAGGDSLLAVRMVADVEKQFGRELKVATVFERPTIRALAKVLEASAPATAPAVTTSPAVALDPAIVVEPGLARDEHQVEHVFLTGATGFLGGFLVDALARRTTGRIHVLVRARSEVEGWRRLRTNLAKLGVWDPTLEKRLVPVLGDLATRRLGLTAEAFRTLGRDVDAIIHAGALVNYLFPYARLAAANVQGTQEILRLATTERLKPVHHVSTVGVFPPRLRGEVIREIDALPAGGEHPMAYARSKWAAEQLVVEGRRRGIPVTIHRPADVGGAFRSGVANSSDILCLTLQACVRAGAVPDVDRTFDIAPVDYVAGAIVELLLQPATAGRIFHLTNPSPVRLRDVVDLMDELGYRLERMPVDAWMARLRTTADATKDASLARVAELWNAAGAAAGAESTAVDWRYDTTEATARLAPVGWACPVVDRALLSRYVEWFVAERLLPPAAESAKARS